MTRQAEDDYLIVLAKILKALIPVQQTIVSVLYYHIQSCANGAKKLCAVWHMASMS